VSPVPPVRQGRSQSDLLTQCMTSAPSTDDALSQITTVAVRLPHRPPAPPSAFAGHGRRADRDVSEEGWRWRVGNQPAGLDITAFKQVMRSVAGADRIKPTGTAKAAAALKDHDRGEHLLRTIPSRYTPC
jgi:hypothetical protein